MYSPACGIYTTRKRIELRESRIYSFGVGMHHRVGPYEFECWVDRRLSSFACSRSLWAWNSPFPRCRCFCD